MSDILPSRLLQRRLSDQYGNDMNGINDIIVQILLRLPTKSLVRFKCVRKSWRNLIADPYFVKKHSSRLLMTDPAGNSSCRLLASTDPPQSIDCKALLSVDLKNEDDDDGGHVASSQLYLHKWLRESGIVSSCNGLVCLLNADFDGGCIWNPCTGHAKKFPQSRNSKYWPPFEGFGYDSTTDDYKVILGSPDEMADYGETTRLDMYTLKTGSWSQRPLERYFCMSGSGCFLNGALHWLELEQHAGEDGVTRFRIGPTSRIISFDLAGEVFRVMDVPLPNSLADGQCGGEIIVTNKACLCVSCFSLYGFTMWVMKEYGVKESWEKLIQIDHNLLGPYLGITPVSILENGRVLVTAMFVDGTVHLELYDPQENKVKGLKVVADTGRGAVMYVETLVSPHILIN